MPAGWKSKKSLIGFEFSILSYYVQTFVLKVGSIVVDNTKFHFRMNKYGWLLTIGKQHIRLLPSKESLAMCSTIGMIFGVIL